MAYEPEVVVKEGTMEDTQEHYNRFLVGRHTSESSFFRHAIKEENFEPAQDEPIDVDAEVSEVSRLTTSAALDNRNNGQCDSGETFMQPGMLKGQPYRRSEGPNMADLASNGCACQQIIIKEEPIDEPEGTAPHFPIVTIKVEPHEDETDDERPNVTSTPLLECRAYHHPVKEERDEGPSLPEGDVPQFPVLTVKCEPYECESASHERLQDTETDVPGSSKSQRKKPLKKFSCYHCGHKSVAKAFLRRHMTKHTEKKRFVCGVCDLSFNYVSHLKTHEMIHSGKRPYTCGICEHTSATSYNLKVHMRSHTGEKPFVCGACDYRTKQKVHLIAHLKKHIDEQPQPLKQACEMCDYRGPSKTALKNHMRLHKDQNPDKCGICDYSNLDKNQMKTHRKSHTVDNLYACNFCDYRSSSSSHVKTHMLTHTGERPHKCDFCDYRCKQRAHLKTHMMTHKKEKPFKCDYCDYRSNQSIHIKTHSQNYCPNKKQSSNS